MQNCSDKCAIFRQIEACREACLKCNVCDDTNTMQTGSRGVVSFDKCGTAGVDALKNRVHLEPAPTEGVTALPADIEDTLRKALADFCGLSPIDWLLIRHLVAGGSLSSFKLFAQRILPDLQVIATGTPETTRVCAFTRFKKILNKCKFAAAVAGYRFGKGHAGAFKKILRKIPFQMDLFT